MDLANQRVLSGNAQVPTASLSTFMVMSVKMHQKEEELRIKWGSGAEQKLVVRKFEASCSPAEPLTMPFEAAELEEVEEALGDHALDEIPKEHDDEYDEEEAPWPADYDVAVTD